jgi:asparagine synthase (glutamine-hydrolysing)
MSMAVSLEARVPLLDHHVVEFATGLPTHLKMRDGTGKWILRQAIASIVPAHVLQRPKRGFAVPVRWWLRSELRHRITHLLRKESPVYEFVDASAVQRIAGEHRLRRRDHSSMLWRLLVLDLWLESLANGQLLRPTAGDTSLRGVTQRARAS